MLSGVRLTTPCASPKWGWSTISLFATNIPSEALSSILRSSSRALGVFDTDHFFQSMIGDRLYQSSSIWTEARRRAHCSLALNKQLSTSTGCESDGGAFRVASFWLPVPTRTTPLLAVIFRILLQICLHFSTSFAATLIRFQADAFYVPPRLSFTIARSNQSAAGPS